MLQSIAVFEQDPENMINVHSVFVWLHRALLKRLVLELCCTGPGEINTASNQMASPLLPRLRQPRRLLLLLVLLLLIAHNTPTTTAAAATTINYYSYCSYCYHCYYYYYYDYFDYYDDDYCYNYCTSPSTSTTTVTTSVLQCYYYSTRTNEK